LQPIALAILIRCRQYSRGILAGCISPLMIRKGFPSSKNSCFPKEKLWRSVALSRSCARAEQKAKSTAKMKTEMDRMYSF
jgi:hypothetical protein